MTKKSNAMLRATAGRLSIRLTFDRGATRSAAHNNQSWLVLAKNR